jgi:hypothetical protein
VDSERTKNKKADVAEHPKVFDHVGLLFNEPPGKAELLFIQSSDEHSLQPEQSGYSERLHLYSTAALPNCHNPNGGGDSWGNQDLCQWRQSPG